MEEWKEYKLGELSIGKGSYGIGASAVPYSPSLHTYLRITDINDDGTLNKNGLMSLDDENADDYILQPNDIVFARTGNSTGRSYFYDGSDGKLVYAGFLIKFSLDSKKVNPRILKYYTHSKTYFDWVRSFDTGGTRGNINAKTYGDMPIVLPPRNLQDKIVSILKSLDDKIEVNRKINENLEQQAQALFKSWFVDFEPFKNGEFVESELGMIPKGWRVGTLGEIADINPSRALKKGDAATYLDMKNMPTSGPFPMCCESKVYTGGMRFQNKDTLMARITPCLENGKVAYVNFLEDKEIAFGSTEYIVMTSKNGFFPELLYFLCRDEDFKGYATKNMNGSSGRQRVSGETIGNYKIAIPPKALIESIASFYKGIMDNIKNNGFESRRLAELRDTLLPKLMSGELKVGDVLL